ncbi:MAG TPA: DUF4142 domain-containing protein [Rhizomicrobium sp.]|nr:DUF4142 domain-containing protein [Rhizomicrobium sp.]
MALLALSPAAQADSPRQFLQNALQGANSEIMLGRMAAERARSPAVREFGQTLVSDHQQARQELRDLGRDFGLRPGWQPSDEARDERQKLDGLRGRDFDREFVRFMIDDHRKDISEFRDEANEQHGRVSDLARNQIPTMRNHLRMAIALERSDGRTSQGGWNMARDRDNDRDYQNDNQYRDNNNGYRNNRSWER